MRNTTVRSASLLGGAQAGNGRFEALDISRCLTTDLVEASGECGC